MEHEHRIRIGNAGLAAGMAALVLSGTAVQAASRLYPTEAAFVAAMARRMTEIRENGATYTEQVAARRCLNYVSGAHGTKSLRQEIGRTNRNFALSGPQRDAFKACVAEEGYRLR